MEKISIDDSIYSLIENNHDIKNILIDMGFTHLSNPAMYNSIAKVMTLRKACRQHKISYGDLKNMLNINNIDLIEEEF